MDIMDYNWRLTGQNVNCPQILISARFCNSNDQSITIGDYRESQGKEVLFPNVVASLTTEETELLIQKIVSALIEIYQNRHAE